MLEIKMNDSDKRNLLQAELDIKGQIINANYEFTQAYERSGELLVNPNDIYAEEPEADSSVSKWVDYLMTYAPFPGTTAWASPLIWVGGAIMVIPLWFIFFVQSAMCRSRKVIMDHQTEWIGGGIQLYFAGAFSFMPLTSDVVIDTSTDKRSQIALGGSLLLHW